MELFDEIIQNKQLEDKITEETGFSSKKEHRNIGKMLVLPLNGRMLFRFALTEKPKLLIKQKYS